MVSFFLLLFPYIIHSKSCDPSCDECLSSSNFDDGTYRITKSGKYCLSEDIEINPLKGTIKNPNSNFNWYPTNHKQYEGSDINKNGPFSLGFFAGITIETDDIEIDLNGYKLSQNEYFCIQQRFFALIEIGNTPFLSGSGPTDFGKSPQNVDNIYIHNGELGLTSHHGIHSNQATNVKISNLKIYDFEVAGIQFNGFNGIIIENVDIGPSSHNVKRIYNLL